MNPHVNQTYYEILEVQPSATQEEIQKAFFKAKGTYSANSPALYSVFTEEEAKEMLRLINEAYAVLSNYQRRKEYDEKLSTVTVSQSPSFDSSNSAVSTAEHGLPDFMVPGGDSLMALGATDSAPVASNSKTSPAQPSPPKVSMLSQTEIREKNGYGKTIISHYSFDPQTEEEIKNQTVFDGTFLQRIRLYKNISLDALSETSRISRPYLLAIETNDYSSLPAPVYTRGFIVAVARLLGLPEKTVADSYMKLFKERRG